VSVHNGLELVFLLEFITGRQALLFLLLVKHHFLDSGSSLLVEIGELRVLRLDLLGVNLRITLNHAIPPVHLVNLTQSHLQGPHGSISLQCPQGVRSLNFLMQCSIDDGRLALNGNLKGLCLKDNVEILGGNVVGKRHIKSDFFEGLSPPIVVKVGSISEVGLEALVLVVFLLLFVTLLDGRLA
jgi:hypothetical protein